MDSSDNFMLRKVVKFSIFVTGAVLVTIAIIQYAVDVRISIDSLLEGLITILFTLTPLVYMLIQIKKVQSFKYMGWWLIFVLSLVAILLSTIFNSVRSDGTIMYFLAVIALYFGAGGCFDIVEREKEKLIIKKFRATKE